MGGGINYVALYYRGAKVEERYGIIFKAGVSYVW
jgi:hypothetical protein